MKYESSNETWDVIEKLYFGYGKLKKVRLQTLRRRTVLSSDYGGKRNHRLVFRQMVNLSNQMSRNGENVTGFMKFNKVLRTLAPRFDIIVVALEESKDLDYMKIEELQASIEAHELRLIGRIKIRGKGVASHQALQAQYVKKRKVKKGKKPWIGQSYKDGEGFSKNHEGSKKEDANSASNKKKKEKKNIQCYNCQKLGHYASECESKRVPRRKGDEAQFARDEDSDSEEVFLIETIKGEEEKNDE